MVDLKDKLLELSSVIKLIKLLNLIIKLLLNLIKLLYQFFK